MTIPAALREALEKLKPWLKHSADCGALQPPYSYCSCGLHYAYDAALTAAETPAPAKVNACVNCGEANDNG